MEPLVALMLLALVAPAHAGPDGSPYYCGTSCENRRAFKRRLEQLCKPVGRPLLAIEGRIAGVLVSRIAIYPTGAWTTLSKAGCVKGRVMSQIRANLYALQWKADPPASCELLADLSPVETRYHHMGRLKFVECGCGPTLRAADDERLVETTAILLALAR